MRLVLDTNVVIAGLLWTGTPRRLLDRLLDETFTLYSSPVLLDELAQTLRYQKFAQRIARSGTTAIALIAQYTALVTLVSPTQVPRVIENDTDDDQVIAAAVTAQADLIVSGDRKHLLPLGSHAGIAIVTPAEGGVYPNVSNGTLRVTNHLILWDFQTHEFRSNRVNFPTF